MHEHMLQGLAGMNAVMICIIVGIVTALLTELSELEEKLAALRPQPAAKEAEPETEAEEAAEEPAAETEEAEETAKEAPACECAEEECCCEADEPETVSEEE